MTASRERPILFSGPMVRALLAGAKTQTRRLINPQPAGGVKREQVVVGRLSPTGLLDGHGQALRCPYGAPGDRLWVRETSALWDYPRGRVVPFDTWGQKTNDNLVIYRAGYEDPELKVRQPKPELGEKWTPAIYMPRWASRLLLEVVELRCQRLQEITPADAVAEGATLVLDVGHPLRAKVYEDHGTWTGGPADVDGPFAGAVDAFATLWDSINGARAPWASNPWVWALTFKDAHRG